MSVGNPSENLIHLVKYIVKVYAPMWFEIKRKPQCYDGPRHFWQALYYSRYLEEPLRKIIDKVFINNAYFAHQENIVLAMLFDERPTIRMLALKKIEAARLQEEKSCEIRKFSLPKIKLDECDDHIDLINWTETQKYEPPLTKKFTMDELIYFTENYDKLIETQYFKLPCHTQAVERNIKLVTEASEAVIPKNRDGFIRNKIKSRSVIKKFG